MIRTTLLALLTLGAATAAHAQSSGPFQGYVYTGNRLDTSTQSTRSFTQYGDVNLTHGFSQAVGTVVGSVSHGTMGASMTSTNQFASGTSQVSLQQRVVFHSFGGPSIQPVELFFDGFMHGPSKVDGYAALGRLRLTIFDGSGSLLSSRTIESRGGRYSGPVDVQQMLIETLALQGGRNEFLFELLLMVQAGQQWTAQFSHTATLYVPPTDGVTMQTAGGFLSEQSRPAWAMPATTVTPEPASLALTATGLLGLLAAARRRQQRAG